MNLTDFFKTSSFFFGMVQRSEETVKCSNLIIHISKIFSSRQASRQFVQIFSFVSYPSFIFFCWLNHTVGNQFWLRILYERKIFEPKIWIIDAWTHSRNTFYIQQWNPIIIHSFASKYTLIFIITYIFYFKNNDSIYGNQKPRSTFISKSIINTFVNQ